MKKYFKSYLIIWALLFVLFNVIVFLIVPNELEVAGLTLDKFAGSFWPGYIAIIVAFLGNFVCSYMFFSKSDSTEKTFLNMPLFTIGRTVLVATLIVGTITMLVLDLPNWIGALVCLLLLAFYAIAVLKARAAAEAVSEIGGKVKAATSKMSLLTSDAEILMNRATAGPIKDECIKVYEKLRYSDPMSSDMLSGIEGKISTAMEELADAVKNEDAESVKMLSEKICEFVDDRSVKCKVLK